MEMQGAYIVVFDGICNFCNGAVNFIIKRYPARKFKFAPMQSETARTLIEQYYSPVEELDTFLLIKDDACLVRTEAALAIAAELIWPWRLCAVFGVVPRTFRDCLYKLFASNRYTLFGRKESCMVPAPSVRDRFLD